MKKICVITSTRADYGILKPLIHKLFTDGFFQLELVVTGSHLSEKFGNTIKEIEADGFPIAQKINIIVDGDNPYDISKTMANALDGFGKYFSTCNADMVIVLGDRFEIFAICAAAVNQQIPIAHLHGGETTVGAVDECFRHSITKMSYLHFTSCAAHQKRVIQLGEDPSRVFDVGALGVENIKTLRFISKKALSDFTHMDLNHPFALVTFHPVTLEKSTAKAQFAQLLSALDNHTELNYIFTKSNADTDGMVINTMIDDYSKTHKNTIAFTSMGALRYLSAMSYATMVIGNSSSGIIEAPSFLIPTINIGDRQLGRLQADSIVNCNPNAKAIDDAITKAKTMDCKNTVNPFGDGNTSSKIIDILKDFFNNNKINLKKEFYDIP